MQLTRSSLALLCSIGAFAALGCHGTSTEPPQATTMPVPEGNMKSAPATMPVPSAAAAAQPTAAAPAAKDMTHVLAKDEPYFTTEPGPSATPAGTLKGGSKVLVIIPGAQYSQVVTDTGISVFTLTDGLKPIGK